MFCDGWIGKKVMKNESFTFSGANKTRYYIYISIFKGIMYIINGNLRLIIHTYFENGLTTRVGLSSSNMCAIVITYSLKKKELSVLTICLLIMDDS